MNDLLNFFEPLLFWWLGSRKYRTREMFYCLWVIWISSRSYPSYPVVLMSHCYGKTQTWLSPMLVSLLIPNKYNSVVIFLNTRCFDDKEAENIFIRERFYCLCVIWMSARVSQWFWWIIAMTYGKTQIWLSPMLVSLLIPNKYIVLLFLFNVSSLLLSLLGIHSRIYNVAWVFQVCYKL